MFVRAYPGASRERIRTELNHVLHIVAITHWEHFAICVQFGADAVMEVSTKQMVIVQLCSDGL